MPPAPLVTYPQVADRTLVEQGSDTILEAAVQGGEVAMLVVGDPFGATTHTDIYLRACELGLRVQVVHNASIMNAVGCTGLQLCVACEAPSRRVPSSQLLQHAFGMRRRRCSPRANNLSHRTSTSGTAKLLTTATLRASLARPVPFPPSAPPPPGAGTALGTA